MKPADLSKKSANYNRDFENVGMVYWFDFLYNISLGLVSGDELQTTSRSPSKNIIY
jgi:hypothetical protein